MDYDNLLTAFEWGTDQRPEDALRLIGNSSVLWGYRTHDAEVQRRLQIALARVDALPPVDGLAARRRAAARGGALLVLGNMVLEQGTNTAARVLIEEGIAIARAINDKHLLADSLNMWCVAQMFEDDYPAILVAAQESIEILEQLGDQWILPGALVQAGRAEMQMGDRVAGQAHLDRAALLISKTPNPVAGYITFAMGVDARISGDFEQARVYFQDSAVASASARNVGFLLMAQSELGHTARHMGDLDKAKEVYRYTIAQFAIRGHRAAVAHQLECFAFIAHAEGQPERATKLLSAAAVLREVSGSVGAPWEQAEFEREVGALRTALGEETFTSMWTASHTFSIDEAVALALSP